MMDATEICKYLLDRRQHMEAAVILAKCAKRNQIYGIRTQKMQDGDWWRTWAFPVDESRARREGYDVTEVQGNLYPTEGYPGCPFCGTVSFVQCNKCRRISCWHGESSVTCPWCGTGLENITLATEKFQVSGGDI